MGGSARQRGHTRAVFCWTSSLHAAVTRFGLYRLEGVIQRNLDASSEHRRIAGFVCTRVDRHVDCRNRLPDRVIVGAKGHSDPVFIPSGMCIADIRLPRLGCSDSVGSLNERYAYDFV